MPRYLNGEIALRFSKASFKAERGGQSFYVRFPSIPDATTVAYFMHRSSEFMLIELLVDGEVRTTWSMLKAEDMPQLDVLIQNLSESRDGTQQG